jgi:hypothetical protein
VSAVNQKNDLEADSPVGTSYKVSRVVMGV